MCFLSFVLNITVKLWNIIQWTVRAARMCLKLRAHSENKSSLPVRENEADRQTVYNWVCGGSLFTTVVSNSVRKAERPMRRHPRQGPEIGRNSKPWSCLQLHLAEKHLQIPVGRWSCVVIIRARCDVSLKYHLCSWCSFAGNLLFIQGKNSPFQISCLLSRLIFFSWSFKGSILQEQILYVLLHGQELWPWLLMTFSKNNCCDNSCITRSLTRKDGRQWWRVNRLCLRVPPALKH